MLCKNCGNPATTTMSMNDGYMGFIGNTQAHLCNDCHAQATAAEHKANKHAAVMAAVVFAFVALLVGGLLILT